MSLKNSLICGAGALALVFSLSGCSSAMKQRKEQREKLAQSSKFYCDFVNGEVFTDVEVQLNLEMAKRCDPEKHFSVSSYKTPSENQGVLYCCSLSGKGVAAAKADNKSEAKAEAKPEAKAEPKAEAKKADKSEGGDELE